MQLASTLFLTAIMANSALCMPLIARQQVCEAVTVTVTAPAASGTPPSFSVPAFSAPSIPSGSFSVPSVPSGKAPSIPSGAFSVPPFSAPSIPSGSFSIPAFSAPAIPSGKAPSVPSISIPSGSFSLPSSKPAAPSATLPAFPSALPSASANKASQAVVSAISKLKSEAATFQTFIAPLQSGLATGATQGKAIASQVPAKLAALSKSASDGAATFKKLGGTLQGEASDAVAKGMTDFAAGQQALLKAIGSARSAIAKYGSTGDVRSALVDGQKVFDAFAFALIDLIPTHADEEKAMQKLLDNSFSVAIAFYN